VARGPSSLVKLLRGLVELRLVSRFSLTDNEALFENRLRPRATIVYRRNQGDLLSLAEVWLRECYRLPFNVVPGTLVDLGANIGLASLWLSLRYGFRNILAVEPDAANRRLARQNLEANHVTAQVLHAAVGATDRLGFFSPHTESNRGSLAEHGTSVQVHSMQTLLGMLPPNERVNLLKVDIEGGEQELFTGDLGWLAAVDALIVEFHPNLVDYDQLVGNVERAGFRFLRHDSAWQGSMDCFVRVGGPQ
jgi:FkbM family methyltransferase